MQEKKEYHERNADEILRKKRISYQKRKTTSETKKNIFEHPQEANDQPTDESIAPEAIGREEPEQPIHIPMINNPTGFEHILNIIQIKGYLTNRLKAEHLEKLIEKVKDKLIRSTIVDGDKNRHSAHVCVVCDCLIIGMEKVDIIEKQLLLINSAKLSVSSYEEYYDGVPLLPELARQH